MALFGGVLHDFVDINNDDKDLLDVQFLPLLFLSARNVGDGRGGKSGLD